jgi:hypothetical protein
MHIVTCYPGIHTYILPLPLLHVYLLCLQLIIHALTQRLFRSPLVGSAQAPPTGSAPAPNAPKFGNNLLQLWSIPFSKLLLDIVISLSLYIFFYSAWVVNNHLTDLLVTSQAPQLRLNRCQPNILPKAHLQHPILWYLIRRQHNPLILLIHVNTMPL